MKIENMTKEYTENILNRNNKKYYDEKFNEVNHNITNNYKYSIDFKKREITIWDYPFIDNKGNEYTDNVIITFEEFFNFLNIIRSEKIKLEKEN